MPSFCSILRSEVISTLKGRWLHRRDSRNIQLHRKICMFPPRVSQTKVCEHSSQDHPHFLYQLQVWEFTRTTLTFDNLLKGLVELIESHYFMVIVYHREKIHINITQRKRDSSQSLGGFHIQNLYCSQDVLISALPALMHDKEHGYCQPGKCYWTSWFSFYWGFIT